MIDVQILSRSRESANCVSHGRSQAVWPDWANYCILGNFSKTVATIIFPKFPTFLAIFGNVSKFFIFLVKSILGNFYRHLATFAGHTGSLRSLLIVTLAGREWSTGWKVEVHYCESPPMFDVIILSKKSWPSLGLYSFIFVLFTLQF